MNIRSTFNVSVMTEKAPEPEMLGTPITGARYTSKDFMDQEMAQMWRKVWMVAGLANELEEPGDYITTQFATQSLLFVKQDDDSIKGFYNVCQHRANKLVLNEEGGADSFTCPYHGWQWDKDGTLLYVQDGDTDFPAGNPCRSKRLAEVQVDIWQGFIWYNFNPDAEPLLDFLGPIAAQVASYDLTQMRKIEHFTTEAPCNWKVILDNFLEAYHVRTVHHGLLEMADDTCEDMQFDLYSQGHSRMWMKGSHPGPNAPFTGEPQGPITEVMKYWELEPKDFADRYKEIRLALIDQKRKLGPGRGLDFDGLADSQLVDHYLFDFFPNMAWSIFPEGRYMWMLRPQPHPTDPQKCIFEMWTMVRFRENEDEVYWEQMDQRFTRDQEVDRRHGPMHEISFGNGIDEDLSIVESMQQGLNSWGFEGCTLAHQERRVQFLHDNVNRYIHGDLPKSS